VSKLHRSGGVFRYATVSFRITGTRSRAVPPRRLPSPRLTSSEAAPGARRPPAGVHPRREGRSRSGTGRTNQGGGVKWGDDRAIIGDVRGRHRGASRLGG